MTVTKRTPKTCAVDGCPIFVGRPPAICSTHANDWKLCKKCHTVQSHVESSTHISSLYCMNCVVNSGGMCSSCRELVEPDEKLYYMAPVRVGSVGYFICDICYTNQHPLKLLPAKKLGWTWPSSWEDESSIIHPASQSDPEDKSWLGAGTRVLQNKVWLVELVRLLNQKIPLCPSFAGRAIQGKVVVYGNSFCAAIEAQAHNAIPAATVVSDLGRFKTNIFTGLISYRGPATPQVGFDMQVTDTLATQQRGAIFAEKVLPNWHKLVRGIKHTPLGPSVVFTWDDQVGGAFWLPNPFYKYITRPGPRTLDLGEDLDLLGLNSPVASYQLQLWLHTNNTDELMNLLAKLPSEEPDKNQGKKRYMPKAEIGNVLPVGALASALAGGS